MESTFIQLKWQSAQVTELLQNTLKLKVDFDWVSDVQRAKTKNWTWIAMAILVGILLFFILIAYTSELGVIVYFALLPSLLALLFISIVATSLLNFINNSLGKTTQNKPIKPRQLIYIELYGIVHGIIYNVQYYFQEPQKTTIQKYYFYDIINMDVKKQALLVQTHKETIVIYTQQPQYLYDLILWKKHRLI